MRGICTGQCPFTQDAAADVDALAARLRDRPLPGPWTDPHGRTRTRTVSGRDLLELIGATDLNPLLSALLPGAVRGALDGDPTPLIALARSGQAAEDETGPDSNAVLLATNCEDLSPVWPLGTPVDARRAFIDGALAALPTTAFGAFGPAVGAEDSTPEICRTWPESPIAQPPVTATDAPTLILSGALDLRTPTEDAQGLAARLPNAQVVHVAGVGHSVLTTDRDPCATDDAVAFLQDQPVHDCTTVDRAVRVVAPAPASLADVPPARGQRGTLGRVSEAAALTVGDTVLRAITSSDAGDPHGFSYGGLRGGSVQLEGGRRLTLHRFSYVPGVALSGPLSGTLRLRAPGGIRGTLHLQHGPRLSGTIAGHRVSVHVDDPLQGALGDVSDARSIARASAMLAPWPTTLASTTSSSSARPGSPAR